jgi:hypothetical protein
MFSGERQAVFIVLDVFVEADFYHIFCHLQRGR